MNWHSWWTLKAKSGRVKVKYWSAPTILLYSMGFKRGTPSEGTKCVEGQQGVLVGLALSMWNLWRMSEAYLDWEGSRPWGDGVI